MPRDKSESHERVIKAAKAEFLEKGFEKASMRSIGERAGMTCAGLYRHYENKADMFNALVEPAINALGTWYEDHMEKHYNLVAQNASGDEVFNNTAINMVLNVVFRYKEEFQLILNCSQGTKYENFVHDLVEQQQKDMVQAVKYMKEHGANVKEITAKEWHMLLSAYITALIEPIKHNWPEEDIIHSLETIGSFFLPGWRQILGY